MTKKRFSILAAGLACAALLLMGQQAGQEPQQPAPAAPPQPESPVRQQPTVKSQEEGQAVMAMFQAQDPDTRIKAAEELLTKFADTEFKPTALHFIAASYQEKNDPEKTIIYAERALEAEPDHYMAMIMLANSITQRTREFDLDREEKLARAEKYATRAIEVLKTAPRPNPMITDEQWTSAKKDMHSQALEALALGALVRKNYNEAIGKFKESIEVASNQDPATLVRLGATYNKAGKHDEAIAILDKVMADPNAHPQIKQFAQAERARAIQSKGGGTTGGSTAPPAAPPPAPDPPKQP